MSRAIRDGRAHRLHQDAQDSVTEGEWEVAFSPEDVDRVAGLVHEKCGANLVADVAERPAARQEGPPEWLGVFADWLSLTKSAREQQETFRGMVLAVMDAMATVAVEKRNVRRDRSGHD
jgi:hypothetical protein